MKMEKEAERERSDGEEKTNAKKERRQKRLDKLKVVQGWK